MASVALTLTGGGARSGARPAQGSHLPHAAIAYWYFAISCSSRRCSVRGMFCNRRRRQVGGQAKLKLDKLDKLDKQQLAKLKLDKLDKLKLAN